MDLTVFKKPSYFTTYFIGGAMKLDPCVSAVIMGFQSTDDTIKMTQFTFTDGESKCNFFEGDEKGVCEYLVSHFCIPGGRVLDLSGEPEGLELYIEFIVQASMRVVSIS